jgi:hypothetical protein
MARLPGIGKKLSKEELQELEAARERSLERLQQIVGGRPKDEPAAPVDEVATPVDEIASPVTELAAPVAELATPVTGPAADLEAEDAAAGFPALEAGIVVAAAPLEAFHVDEGERAHPADEAAPDVSSVEGDASPMAPVRPAAVEAAGVPAGAGRNQKASQGVVVGVMDPAAHGRKAEPVVRTSGRKPSYLAVDEGWEAEAAVPDAVTAAPDPDAAAHPKPVKARAARAKAPKASDDAEPDARPSRGRRGSKTPSTAPRTVIAEDGQPTPPPPPRTRAVRKRATHPKRAPRRKPLVVLAACPSCAVLLDPPPTASRRCPSCRSRIVVKRLQGGVLYLTDTAAAALEAGQRLATERARLARARDRWLGMAAAVGATVAKLDRLATAIPSPEVVAAARALYLASADRAFTLAIKERRYSEAATMRRSQAAALHKDLGAPVPAPAEVVALLRDAGLAELRACRFVGRDAELSTGSCCSACQADDGRIVSIAVELKRPGLPHEACQKGRCRCRWMPAKIAGRLVGAVAVR